MSDYLLTDQETERLRFRKLAKSDFDTWLPFHLDPKTSEFWEGLPPNPEVACRQQFDRVFERYEKGSGGMNVMTLKATENFIGLCGLLVQTVDGIQELEIAYSVLPQYWQKGYATEAAKKCTVFAKAHNLAQSLISIIHVNNIPSQKVAMNNGMHLDKTTTYHNNQVHIFRAFL